MSVSVCVCTTYRELVEGQLVEGVTQVNPDCPEHGRGDEWRTGDPLRVHAMHRNPETGELTSQPSPPWDHRTLETPREVEARLVREAAA